MFNVTFRYSDGEVNVHTLTAQGVQNIISPLNLDRAEENGLVSITVELAS